MLPTYRVGAVVACLAIPALAGCVAEGGVEIQFQLPESADLSPAGTDLAEITLFTYLPDGSHRSETRAITDRSQALQMGRMEVSDGVDLAVELRSPTQQLLGYGRSPGAIEVLADQVVQVPMNVRRPFLYVSGGPTLASFDASLEPTDPSYRGELTLSRQPAVTVATSDGAQLVVVSQAGTGAELSLVSTSDHQELGVAPIALVGSPVDAAISPDDQFVVVGHAGDAGGVSIVDLAAARNGESAVEFVSLGAVGAVEIGARSTSGHGVALLDRSTEIGCPTGGAESSLVEFSLTDPDDILATISLGGPINDIAVSDDGQRVAIADGCAGQLAVVDLAGDRIPTQLSEVPAVSAVAAFDDRLWSVGTVVDGTQRRLVIVSTRFDGTGESRVEMAPAQERARSNDFVAPGQTAMQILDADALVAYDLALVPGADQLALLVKGYYAGEEDGDFLGSPIIPAMQLTAYQYLLVDAASGSLVHQVRTSCDLSWESDPFLPPVLDDWACAQAPDQDVSSTQYRPIHVAGLYGKR